MEAPKCKICGDRHWGMCRPVKKALKQLDADPDYSQKPTTITPTEAKKMKTGTFDRVAYQRDYMRKRRAALKALKQHP